ncbi:helix-turn-helix domain-containing protein [Mesonia sp. K7]|uniref:helix-turn-helix domain-containing protein n=1 Tax=Mesonia sp. K7 TaxID=2218606 RepID=UPI000DA7EFD9|nr:helix-turn-helix domain-containing protein [Mesonia sp. K7]PZD79660.1 DNA-binding protein [Mesonia sp. K7]
MENLNLVQVTPEQLEQLINRIVKEQLEKLKGLFKIKQSTDYLSREDVATLLKINKSTLHNWVKKGDLKSYGIGGRVYFKRAEIEEAMVKL